MSIKCNLKLTEFNDMNGGEFTDETNQHENSNRKKRRLAYSDDIIYLYDDNEPNRGDSHLIRNRRAVHEKTEKMSLKNATEYCRKTILNTAAAQICLETSGVDSSSAIKSCAADLQVSN